MNSPLLIKKNALEKYHRNLLNRSNTLQAFFNRNIFAMYQKYQLARFESENSTETGQWTALNRKYAEYKKTKFADFPGKGTKMMIARGNLMLAATGQSGYTKVATNHGLTVALQENYIGGAKYATERRPVMKFSDEHVRQMRDAISKFMAFGVGG
jgi:hypothetical protein